jgi:hypothetical protein
VIGDREREVDIRVSISGVHRQRADESPGDDARVIPRERQHTIAKRVALLEGEHVLAMVAGT